MRTQAVQAVVTIPLSPILRWRYGNLSTTLHATKRPLEGGREKARRVREVRSAEHARVFDRAVLT